MCGGSKVTRSRRKAHDSTLSLDLYGKHRSGEFRAENVTGAIVRDLHSVNRDLLEIASYVYLADTEIQRWTPRDLVNAKWVRDLHFVVPVGEPALWSSRPINDQLARTLSAASGDRYTFTFVPRVAQEAQLFTDLQSTPFPGADSVCLFSGGADSLTGALYAAEKLGRRPLLVSHRSSSRLDSRQENLRNRLNQRRRDRWTYNHISVWLHRSGTPARETTQRTRGFLFTTLASTIARELRIPLVLVPENGPVSLNVRKLQQSYNSTLSRTTSPVFLHEYGELLDQLPGARVSIENPFIFRTKTEVLGLLRELGAESLLGESVSCAHLQGRSNAVPHCGVCSQCIDRRIASIAADLETHDPSTKYEKDIFVDAIPEGDPLMQVEGHSRLMARIIELSDDDLADELLELENAAVALPGPASQNTALLLEMMRRYAGSFITAYRKKFDEFHVRLLSRQLPSTCLLRLTGNEVLQQNKTPSLFHQDTNGIPSAAVYGDIIMGDKYTTGQAGAVGPHSHAHDINFAQIWSQMNGQADLPQLAGELGRLRSELKRLAETPEQDAAVAEVAHAQAAAQKGDGPTMLSRLSKAGSWAFGVSTQIGVALAAEAIKRSLGMP